jgi:hypothetical protein
MTRPPLSSVGILPIGALGAAFYYHLSQGCTRNQERIQFIERRGSTRQSAIAARGTLTIASQGVSHTIETAKACRPDLVACGLGGWIPDVVLVVTQPDQLLPVISDYVQLLEVLYESHGLERGLELLPILVMSSNGIYHERVRRFMVELLEESMLYGRLPDLWNDSMGIVVGKLLRGVTVQTGYREGDGPTAIFHAGLSARTTIAGGSPSVRRACTDMLVELGGWFEASMADPPVRVEFDKAMVNLWCNLLGQLKAIDDSGQFRLLKVREILNDTESPELRELSGHLFSIGRAVRAYRPDEDFNALHLSTFRVAISCGDHYPSSLKWLETQIQSRTLQPQLTPTEKWLVDPLVHYAKTAGLEAAADYFVSLRQRIEAKLATVIAKGGV